MNKIIRDQEVLNTTESGSDFSVKLILNGYKSPTVKTEKATADEVAQKWDIAISNSKSTFGFRQNKFSIQTGQKIQVSKFTFTKK